MLLKPAPGRTVYYERSRTKLPEEGADIPTPLSTHWHRAINAGDVIAADAKAAGVSGTDSVVASINVERKGAGTVAGGEHWTHPKDAATVHGAGSVGGGAAWPDAEPPNASGGAQWAHPRPEAKAEAASVGGAASIAAEDKKTATVKGA